MERLCALTSASTYIRMGMAQDARRRWSVARVWTALLVLG